MTPNIESLKQKLEAEKGEIEAELAKIGYRLNNGRWETKPIEDEADIEFRDEVADEMEDMEERRATEATLVKRLSNVDIALAKIAQDNYGRCEVGDETIEAERLEANPAARTCKQHFDQEDLLR